MADRKDIREAVYDNIEQAVNGLVPAEKVVQENPDSTESLPTVVHNDAYRHIPMNTDTGPSDTVVSGGEIVAYVYTRLMEAQFSCTIRAADEVEKENIYEALRRYFEKYTMPVADETNIHPDVYRVEVNDSVSDDNEEREPVARGDTLTVNVFFQRYYERPVDAVESVQQTFDIDDDDTVEINNTIT